MIDGWMNGQMEGWTDGQMDRWRDGWMDRWRDGWIGRGVDGWMGGWGVLSIADGRWVHQVSLGRSIRMGEATPRDGHRGHGLLRPPGK